MKAQSKRSKTKQSSKSKSKSKEKSTVTKSRTSTKRKLDYGNITGQYLDQNIMIGKKSNQTSRNFTEKREITSALNITHVRTESRNTKKRSVSSLGMVRKNIKIKNILQYDINELVTQQDVIMITQNQTEKKQTPVVTEVIQYKAKKKLSEEKAAILIQKMWRGYQTRNIIKFYLDLYKNRTKVRKQNKETKNIKKQQYSNQKNSDKKSKKPKTNQQNNNKSHTHKKKLSDIVDLNSIPKLEQKQQPKIENQSSIDAIITKTSPVKQQKTNTNPPLYIQQSLNKLKSEQMNKWNEIINLINQIPKQDLNNNELLYELMKKSQENKNKLENLDHTIITSPKKKQKEVQKPVTPNIIINSKTQIKHLDESENPLLKIFEFRFQMLKQRQKMELQKLQKKLKLDQITKEQYESKKQRIISKYLKQKKQINQNKTQICFGIQKAHEAIISSKKDAEFLHKVTGKVVMIRHSLSSESLFQSFIKDKVIIDQTPSITPSSSIQSLHLSTRRRNETNQIAIEQTKIHQQQKLNTVESEKNDQQKKLRELKNSVIKIQQDLQSKLIDQICSQIYENDKFYQIFQPLIDIHNIFNFKKVQDQEIRVFLNQIEEMFMPNQNDLLKRLNQKINPNPRQLLKILRNQQLEEQQAQFYELVISQDCFKKFREWKQNFIQKQLQSQEQLKFLNNQNFQDKNKLLSRFAEVKQRKKKLLRFQKDLQAMYYKSVFNCFNESIIQVKSSYSSLNGRSTIGPGELRLSMMDSNIEVQRSQIKGILSKAKFLVLQNIKLKCPILNLSNYMNLFKFQESLTKQISYEFQLNQFKWVSYFDQILQLSIQLTRKIQNFLIQQIISQILK